MSSTRFLDLDLLLEPNPQQGELPFQVRVLRSPTWRSPNLFANSLNANELSGWKAKAEGTITSTDAQIHEARESAVYLGQQLFKTVFQGELYNIYRSSIDAAERQGKALRVLLHFSGESLTTELVKLPWELLHDGKNFIALSNQTPIVRLLEVGQRGIQFSVRPPLRVLLVWDHPPDSQDERAHVTWQHFEEIREEVHLSGFINFDMIFNPTIQDLQTKLREREFQILHIVSHQNEGAEAGVIESLLNFKSMDILLAGQPELRLLILNSRQSGLGAGAIKLIRHVPSILTIPIWVQDESCYLFTREFYLSIIDQLSIDVAVADARKALYLHDFSLEWALPVLYSFSEDTQILSPANLTTDERKRFSIIGLTGQAQIALTNEEYERASNYAAQLSNLGARQTAESILEETARAKRLREWYEHGQTSLHEQNWYEALIAFRSIQISDFSYRDVSELAKQVERRIVQPRKELLRKSRLFDANLDMLAAAFLEGRVVPVLGMGINLLERPAAGVAGDNGHAPTPNEVAERIMPRSFATDQGSLNLASLSQELADVISADFLYKRLHAVFDRDFLPSTLHVLLATLPRIMRDHRRFFNYPIIVSTNYDDVLERTFQAAGEAFDLVTYMAEGDNKGKFRHTKPNGELVTVDSPNEYADLDPHERVIIVKLHGIINRQNIDQDSFVVMEDHYLNYLAQANALSIIPTAIMAQLKKSHFLFMGIMVRDWSIRGLLQKFWEGRQNRKDPSFIVQGDLPELERKMWQRRHIDLIDCPLDVFILEFAERIKELSLLGD